MKKSRFMEKLAISILKEDDDGLKVKGVYFRYVISAATLFN